MAKYQYEIFLNKLELVCALSHLKNYIILFFKFFKFSQNWSYEINFIIRKFFEIFNISLSSIISLTAPKYTIFKLSFFIFLLSLILLKMS